MMTNQERVRIGLTPIYFPAAAGIATHLEAGERRRMFYCWICAREGSWEATVIDPGERDTLLCPSCHNIVGMVADGYYDTTLDEWRQALQWHQQHGHTERIPVTGGAAKGFLVAMGWQEHDV